MENTPSTSILIGAGRILLTLPRLAAGIIGLSSFAYAIGWIYARSYFSVFGADWLISEVPTLTILSYSWWPIVSVLFYAFLGVTDLAKLQEGKIDIENSSLYRMMRYLSIYGGGVLVIILLLDPVLGSMGYLSWARALSQLSVFLTIGIASFYIESFAINLTKRKPHVSHSMAWAAYCVIFFCLYLAPTQMGRNDALQAISSEKSSLPFVALRGEPTHMYRLLLMNGERFYVFPDKFGEKYPPLSVASPQEVLSIQKRINAAN